MKRVVILMSFAVLGTLTVFPSSMAKKPKARKVSGEQVFQSHCASCHVAGGNRVSPSKPVYGSSELSTIVKFKSYLSAPPGHMPSYEDVVGDKEALDALYKYCKHLKKPLNEASAGELAGNADDIRQ